MEYYNIYAEYLRHESGLINQRIGWLLTANGFLIGSIGVIVGHLISLHRSFPAVNNDAVSVPLLILLAMLAVIGLTFSAVISFVVVRGLQAAESLQVRWDQIKTADGDENLPNLMGGFGRGFSKWRPMWLSSLALATYVVVFVWLVIVAYFAHAFLAI